MPLLSPESCATLMALLAALMDPVQHDAAVRMAAQTSAYAIVLVNAYEQHCGSCIAAVLDECGDD